MQGLLSWPATSIYEPYPFCYWSLLYAFHLWLPTHLKSKRKCKHMQDGPSQLFSFPQDPSNPRSVMPKEPRTNPLSHLLQPLHAFAVNLSTWNIPSATTQSLGNFQRLKMAPCLDRRLPRKLWAMGNFCGMVINDLSSSKTFGNSKVMSLSFPLLPCGMWWIYFISFYYINHLKFIRFSYCKPALAISMKCMKRPFRHSLCWDVPVLVFFEQQATNDGRFGTINRNQRLSWQISETIPPCRALLW